LKIIQDLFEVAFSFVLKEIMDGNQDRADIANKTFDRLIRMGYVEDDIHNTLEVIFSLDEMVEGSIFSSGIQNVVFEIYDPKQRIPVELLQIEEKDTELEISFRDLYKGSLSPERFELFVEAGEDLDVPDDTPN